MKTQRNFQEQSRKTQFESLARNEKLRVEKLNE